ncbi:alpha/beta hydrolase [Halorubellus sp. JP-L1]|uniref:alpha/beta fold hydrolase n=1 Tax=Halorubellus sp. JP-L1 TaxID=2715753 RepID=UPI00140B15E6|nr:alpha/beta hydrolase [Halorubellus sp. JP-L1]NHN40292.1 alpha/beta hydrolase [Halorubellus sp. JP-L1]
MIPDDERANAVGADGEGTDESVDGDDGPANVGSGVAVVDGRQIAYRRAGSTGPPLVLLHGAGVDDAGLSWEHVLPALGREHRVYAIDWPGHGDSDDAPEHSIDAYRRVLAGVLDDLGLESVRLAGISLGAGVALSFALESPERVSRLAALSSYGIGESIPAGSLWYALANLPGANQAGYAAMGTSTFAARNGLSQVVHDVSALDPSFVEAFRERASRRGAGAAFAAFQRNEIGPSGRVATNLAPRLPDLAVETLFVHGRDDPLFPVEWARRAAERAPNATLVEIPACGHWPTHEHPEVVVDALSDFFAD